VPGLSAQSGSATARRKLEVTIGVVIASHRVGAARRPMTGSSEAIQGREQERLDCFVAEPVIGLAEGETRWLPCANASRLSQAMTE